MNKVVILAILAGCSAGAMAQDNVTLYGLVDTIMRYGSTEKVNAGNKLQMSDGFLTGSRWGLRASENLGGSLKAVTVLEAGFSPDTGASQQGGRLFGRQSYVGLEGDFGKLLLGRQYTIAYDTLCTFDAFDCANNSIMSYQDVNYAGLRYDNTVKYSKALNNVVLSAAYSFGEIAGSTSSNSAKGFSATYTSGPFYLGAMFQSTDSVSSNYFNAVPTAQASKQNVWAIGGAYQFDAVKWHFGYTNSKLDVAGYKNDVFYTSFNYQLAPMTSILGTIQYDEIKHLNADGKRITSALMLDHFLSKRTDVYVAVDYSKLQDGWLTLISTGLGTAARATRSELTVGIRHRF